MDGTERRKYKRLGAEFDISCREVGSPAQQPHTGCTVNLSPGGLYFETASATLKPGSLLELELSIPPRQGVLEFGGRISAFARILRTNNIYDSATGTKGPHFAASRKMGPNLSSQIFGVAVQFCRSPKLCM